MNRRLVLLLPTLLLAACGQQQSVTSPSNGVISSPAHPQRVGNIYVVSFQRVGAPDFTVSAQRLAAGDLTSQRLINGPPQTTDFTFTRLGVSTFVVDATNTRHIRATFKVTNNSGHDLYNLNFLPVVTGGNTTPFRDIKYFDGSDASSKASSLTATQGKSLKPSTGQAVVDSDSSLFRTNLDLSGVTTPGIQNYGWKAASVLANGASTNVTFAVDLPMDPAGTRSDPYNFSLSFAPVIDQADLRSAVQQYHHDTKTFGNYTVFKTSTGGFPHSPPAYYDVLNANPAVLCSDSGVLIQDISSDAFPHRFRVEVKARGDHTLSVYEATSCPAPGTTALFTQTVTGIGPSAATIAGGDSHSLALKADGTVQAWGYNGYGELGDGTNNSSPIPIPVPGLANAAGVAAGSLHSLALMADGTVRAWGYNSDGQLGNGTNNSSTTPVAVSGLTGVVDVASGYSHNLALMADGTVRAWGYNSDGELGNGNTFTSPTPVTAIGLTDIVGVDAGAFHSLALKADGTVLAWGYNGYGQLGDTSGSRSVPAPVPNLTGVSAVAAGVSHSLALKNNGTVQAWGANSNGQLGNGTTTDSATPVNVTGLTGVVGITASKSNYYYNSTFSLALKSDGTVRAWGIGGQGQLGNGTNTDSTTPVTVTGLTGASEVAAGQTHSLALKTDGTMRAWGTGGQGQLGNGTNTDSTTPVTVSTTGIAQPMP